LQKAIDGTNFGTPTTNPQFAVTVTLDVYTCVVVTQRWFHAYFQTRWAPSFKTIHKLEVTRRNGGHIEHLVLLFMLSGSMIQSLCWNSDTNMLAAVQDTNIIVWYYPTVLYVDKRLVKKTVTRKDAR
jgi:hypothetical protein